MPHGWLDGTPAHSRLPVSLEPEPTHEVSLPLTVLVIGRGVTPDAAGDAALALWERVKALVEASTKHCYGDSVQVVERVKKEDVSG